MIIEKIQSYTQRIVYCDACDRAIDGDLRGVQRGGFDLCHRCLDIMELLHETPKLLKKITQIKKELDEEPK